MKTAIYIEDGIAQLVLTPQDDFEKNTLKSFQEKPLTVKIFDGVFTIVGAVGPGRTNLTQ